MHNCICIHTECEREIYYRLANRSIDVFLVLIRLLTYEHAHAHTQTHTCTHTQTHTCTLYARMWHACLDALRHAASYCLLGFHTPFIPDLCIILGQALSSLAQSTNFPQLFPLYSSASVVPFSVSMPRVHPVSQHSDWFHSQLFSALCISFYLSFTVYLDKNSCYVNVVNVKSKLV